MHGGPDLVEPMLIDPEALAKLRRLIPLAPLHQPHNIAGIEAAMKAFPVDRRRSPASTPPSTAATRSSPTLSPCRAPITTRACGATGSTASPTSTSCRKLKAIAPQVAREDVIIAHLGNGASMCAVHDGRSIASTMGFTALDGLPMGTRCGQLDPGVLLYLMAEKKMGADGDLRPPLQEFGPQGHVRHFPGHARARGLRQPGGARRHRLFRRTAMRRELGALAATVDGAEAVVFTGGIGEHSWRVRENGPDRDGVDGHPNRRRGEPLGRRRSSAPSSPTIVFVIPTDEERMIAEHTVRVAGVAEKEAKTAD